MIDYHQYNTPSIVAHAPLSVDSDDGGSVGQSINTPSIVAHAPLSVGSMYVDYAPR
jgi:hypothetical protein